MSYFRKQSSSRLVRRGRRSDRRGRQLGIETLERRDCPAVMFDFVQGDEGGVLTITGDDGPNVIEISRRSDGVVDALGDGERHTFKRVNEIVARTGNGDDHFLGKIVLWVRDTSPFTLDLDAGAGADVIEIADGPPTEAEESFVVTSFFDIYIDLGTGVDDLLVALKNTPNVSLDVISADGGDRIEGQTGTAGILVGYAGGPISYSCNLRASLQLGGGDNDVKVSADGCDHVDLDLVALGGGNTVQIKGEAEAYTAEGASEKTNARISLDFSAGGNLLDVSTDGFDDVNVDASILGDGNEVEINQGWGPWETHPARILTQNPTSRTNLTLKGDGNKVGFRTQRPMVELTFENSGETTSSIVHYVGILFSAIQKIREGPAPEIFLALGEGGDVDVGTVNFDDVKLSITATSREPDVAAFALDVSFKNLEGNHQTGGSSGSNGTVSFRARNAPSGLDIVTSNFDIASINVATGDSDDDIRIQGKNLGAVSVDVNTAGGNDSIWIDMGAPILTTADGRGRVGLGATLQLKVDAGEGDDMVELHTQGTTPGLGIIALSRPPSRLDQSVDLGPGNDRLVATSQDLSAVATFIDAGAGDDDVLFGGAIRVCSGCKYKSRVGFDVHLGAGDDRLMIYVDGYGTVTSFFDAGAGDDRINANYRLVGAARPDDSRIGITALLGNGSDVFNFETLGFLHFAAHINTGSANDGLDVIVGDIRFVPTRGRVQEIRGTLDNGLDLFDLFVAADYDIQATWDIHSETVYLKRK